MKILFYTLIFFSVTKVSLANDAKKPYFPTTNSDFFYYFLRHENNPQEFVFDFSREVSRGEKRATIIKAYFPLYNGENLSVFLPTFYSENNYKLKDVQLGDHQEQKISKFFWQTIWNYKLSSSEQLTFITEHRMRDTTNSFENQVGDDFAPLLSYRKALNERWSYMVLGRHLTTQKNNGAESSFGGGLQIFWKAADNLKLSFGAPGLFGLEAQYHRFELMTHTQIEDKLISNTTALRYHFNDSISTTLRFRDESDQTWTELTQLPAQLGSQMYNHVMVRQQKINLELGYKLTKEILLQGKMGYILGGSMQYLQEEQIKNTTAIEEQAFLGIDIALNF